MNRTYTKEHFVELALKIRDYLPGAGISTDIIVGFPGETDDDFEDTIDVMNRVNFDSAYTFKYSPRKGTKATEYDDQVDESIKQDRLSRVIALQKSHTLLRNEVYVGNIENVLIEKKSKRNKSMWTGRTDSNKWVVFDKSGYSVNDIVPVLITESRGITLHGKISKKIKAA